MKKLIILLISNFIYSQHPLSGVVEYTIDAIEIENPLAVANSSTDHSKQKELLEIFSHQPATGFILEFNGYEAIYKRVSNEMTSDANQKSKPKFLEMFGGGSSLFYSNSKEKTTLTQKTSFGELFLINSTFPEWELTNEKKKIGNYICYKAIKKKITNSSSSNEIVWYTPELPFQFGPTVYVGLPGLVLEVNAGKIRFTATKIQLNNETVTIIKPEKGTKISELEYIKKLEKISSELGF